MNTNTNPFLRCLWLLIKHRWIWLWSTQTRGKSLGKKNVSCCLIPWAGGLSEQMSSLHHINELQWRRHVSHFSSVTTLLWGSDTSWWFAFDSPSPPQPIQKWHGGSRKASQSQLQVFCERPSIFSFAVDKSWSWSRLGQKQRQLQLIQICSCASQVVDF